eukprot:8073560-Alexandrium_andersonii.AAC.1
MCIRDRPLQDGSGPALLPRQPWRSQERPPPGSPGHRQNGDPGPPQVFGHPLGSGSGRQGLGGPRDLIPCQGHVVRAPRPLDVAQSVGSPDRHPQPLE